MNNTFLFIIWNKALWCKDKIINDLKETFTIISIIEISWDKEKFETNLKSLYGRKIGSAKEKIDCIGNKPFLLIIVKDNKPKYENRPLYDGEIGKVNINVYDKKTLYRKWTAGCHRIHCSDTNEETIHDLIVLFGNNYKNIINRNTKLSLNTKTVEGFNNKNDIISCLKKFTKCIIINNKDLIIISKYKLDIIYFLNAKKIDQNHYLLNNKNIIIDFYIFSKEDFPNGTIDKILNNEIKIQNFISKNYIDYIKYLQNKKLITKNISSFFRKNKLKDNFPEKEIDRIVNNYSFLTKIIRNIKLIIFKITNK